jgi:pyridoxine kinase
MAGAVIAISSHVARGSVGNRAMVFALERLGFDVWAVPTVLLPYHPGHGPGERIVPGDNEFSRLLQDLSRDGRAKSVAGIVSGYLGSPGQAVAVSELVKAVKAARPDAIYLCDPVLGDAGGLYVDPKIAEAIRDALLPLADAATPNAFECAWLARNVTNAKGDPVALARSLPPPVVLATSALALMRRQIGSLITTDTETLLFEHPEVGGAAKGTGDLLAGLFLARRLQNRTWAEAAQLAVASVYEIAARTAKAGADELMLTAFQDSLIAPRATISVRSLR